MNGQEKARHIVVVMAKTATQVWTRDERKPKAGCGFKSEERFYRIEGLLHIAGYGIDYVFVWVEYFGESGGHLHLVPILRTGTNHQADVYGMRRDYSGWLVKCQVDLHVAVRTYLMDLSTLCLFPISD
uniref:Uncharacterized protein n=1 Tax=Populus trichocarpa TaxID=3694 RepID=A0A2K2BXV8_POPTR